MQQKQRRSTRRLRHDFVVCRRDAPGGIRITGGNTHHQIDATQLCATGIRYCIYSVTRNLGIARVAVCRSVVMIVRVGGHEKLDVAAGLTDVTEEQREG